MFNPNFYTKWMSFILSGFCFENSEFKLASIIHSHKFSPQSYSYEPQSIFQSPVHIYISHPNDDDDDNYGNQSVYLAVCAVRGVLMACSIVPGLPLCVPGLTNPLTGRPACDIGLGDKIKTEVLIIAF